MFIAGIVIGIGLTLAKFRLEFWRENIENLSRVDWQVNPQQLHFEIERECGGENKDR